MSIKLGANGLPPGRGLYWKGETIYLAIWKDGKKRVYCTRTSDWKKALEFRTEQMALKSEPVVVPRGLHLSDLFDDYIAHLESKEAESKEYANHTKKYMRTSYKARARINKWLVPPFGKLRPDELTADHLRAYKLRRTKEAGSVATVNSEFRLLRAALKLGADAAKIDRARIPSFKNIIADKAEKKLARTGTITLDNYQKICAALAPHLKPLFVTAYWTGVRAKELRYVRRANVDFANNTITLNPTETKSGDLRVLPLNNELRTVLLSWEESTRENFPKTIWLFHLQGEQIGEIQTGWNAALRRCGLRVQVFLPNGEPDFRWVTDKKTGQFKKRMVWKNLVKFHDTRRTMVSLLDELDIEERDTMKVSGHATASMNRRYNQSKAAANRIRIAQNKLLGFGAKEALPTAPTSPVRDWKAALLELKELHENGLLPEDVYKVEVSKVMANR
jgi:integrase